MGTLTIKNVPDDLYAQLRRHAKMNHRSINSEAIVCIEKAVRSHRIPPGVALMRARKLREKTSDHPITNEEFIQAKATGRP